MQRLIETASLFVLIGVTILRPLVAESYDSAGSPLSEALEAVSDPSPVRTLVFDLLILCAAGGWLVARMIGLRRPYRWTGLEWGGCAIVIAVVISCLAAGNKRLAINGSVDWLCYPLLTISLVQFLRRPWHRRLLLAALLASACAQAAKCFEQYSVGFDETWEHYQSIKEDFWARQGIDLDSSRVEAFEQRMQAREATGFMPHSNVTGSYLVLCAFPAGALALAGWKRSRNATERLLAIGATVAIALIIVAVPSTKSVGAMTAGIVGLVVWVVVRLARGWIDAHRAGAVAIGWACAVAGLLGVVGYGLYNDKLPGVSLTFRWQYWRASSDLIADHGLTGVGRENFGRHYLRYKPIESPEEVANPHNLFVQASADWGVLGLVGVVAMMVGASRAAGFSPRGRPPVCGVSLFRSSARAKARGSPDEVRGSPRTLTMAAWTAALALVVIVGRLPLLGTNDPNFLYYATVTTGLAWLAGFVCFAFGAAPSSSPGDPWERLVSTGVAIGLFTFVLHDMINFAAFVPGTATTFFALLAVCIAKRSTDGAAPFHEPLRRRRTACADAPRELKLAARRLPLAVLSAAIVVVGYVAFLPVARAAAYMRLARAAGRQLVPAPGVAHTGVAHGFSRGGVAHGFGRGEYEVSGDSRPPPLKRWATRSAPVTAQVAYHHFQSAAAADPLDPTPHVERAKWLMNAASVPELREEALGLAVESLAQAVERDPFSSRLRRMQMQLYQTRAEATGGTDDRLAAIEAARQALELYPLDPTGIAALADCQLEAGEAGQRPALLDSHDLLRDAIKNYQRALALDDARLEWETLRRFRPKEREAIQSKTRRAQQLLDEPRP